MVTSSRREDFAVVHDQARGTLTVAVSCASSSAWLVERDDADGWVSAWHSWLAGLGYLPAVRWVAVIVETAPEPGTALHDSVAARVDPAAPADVRTLLRDLVARAPAATAHVRTWVCVTFDDARLLGGGSAAGGNARVRHSRAVRVGSVEDVHSAAAEADRLMSGLESSLGACGVTVRGRATAEDLVEVAAVAYDPGYRGRGPVPSTRRELRGRGAHGWDHASPVAVEEGWDQLRHDSGTSVSWGWQEAPRQLVTSDVLSRLHSPGRYLKRVCLLYRPMPAADAARLLESEVNAADFRDAVRRAQRRDETARDVADREQARRAAREEAVGAGVVLVSAYVTTTVTDPEQLADAVADVEARADQTKIRLRRLYGGQSVGFATTLPLGLHPVALTSASGRLSGRGRP
ncbi:hypothetical protein F1641_11870 [Quadrisphaera sp. INWT6]|nr:SCO6880 family protein [Quadrisphaera sp. INWT6]MBF5082392.1 hypothetical protein [Quadrisphaera sp. INWT6]